jgi:hypothetical protein
MSFLAPTIDVLSRTKLRGWLAGAAATAALGVEVNPHLVHAQQVVGADLGVGAVRVEATASDVRADRLREERPAADRCTVQVSGRFEVGSASDSAPFVIFMESKTNPGVYPKGPSIP